MIRVLIFLLSVTSISVAGPRLDWSLKLGTVPMSAKFAGEGWTHWGGSLVKGEDGLYHMFYSRWETDLGWAWVTDSEIAHAVSESPFGPFEFQGVALPPRGAEYWDGLCTHNPTIHKFDGKYYLYYMGNTGDGVVTGTPGKEKLNWVHRNNQRIGVAVADSPYGPWQRFDEPLIDVSEDPDAIDSLMTSNPSITLRPDGGYVMVNKVVGTKRPPPNGGPVLHGAATSDSPTGPFTKHPEPVFEVPGDPFPAEDPYIWYQEGQYWAVVKRIKRELDPGNGQSHRVFSLNLYESQDGIHWQAAKNHHVSDRFLHWEDGTVQQLVHLERPQLYIEDGIPKVLLCAADIRDENNVRRAFNVQIPVTFGPAE